MLNVNLQAASALGLTVWQPRTVRCLVVQHCTTGWRHALQPAAQKVLTGMLSVLELPESEYKLATLFGNNSSVLQTQLQGLIKRWQPKFVLVLDTALPSLNLPNVVQTYSPSYLQHNSQYKSSAYKSLLTLRAMLHGTS